MKSIARIITDNSGSIIFEGSNLMVKKAEDLRGMGIAYMMQGGMVYSTLSVQEHLNFALLPLDKNEKETKKMEIFQNFPILQTLLTKRGGQLSGGQKQMLSFAMLLATNARLWLLDEPTAGLSPRSVEEFLLFINGINRLITVSMLVVEHNNYIIDHLKYKYYLQ